MHYLHVATATLILFTISLILGRQKHLPDWILIVWLMIFFLNVTTFFILESHPQPSYTWEIILLDVSDASVFYMARYSGSTRAHSQGPVSGFTGVIYFI